MRQKQEKSVRIFAVVAYIIVCFLFVRDMLREGEFVDPFVELYVKTSITPMPKEFYDGFNAIP